MPRRPYERRGGPTKAEWLRAANQPPRGVVTTTKQQAAAELHPCVQRGEQLGTTPCEIGCRSKIKVYSCALLGKCTLSPKVTSLKFCGTCDQREPPPL